MLLGVLLVQPKAITRGISGVIFRTNSRKQNLKEICEETLKGLPSEAFVEDSVHQLKQFMN